jgi:hypothetical protein
MKKKISFLQYQPLPSAMRMAFCRAGAKLHTTALLLLQPPAACHTWHMQRVTFTEELLNSSNSSSALMQDMPSNKCSACAAANFTRLSLQAAIQ